MTRHDVELMIRRAKEKYPDAKAKIISDNGSQFTGKDFREFIKFLELTHIRTSAACPQSNGKLERFYRSLGIECFHTNSFISIEDARIIIAKYIEYYNRTRLHSALYYLSPEDFLLGREKQRVAQTEQKLQKAALQREEYWKKNEAA